MNQQTKDTTAMQELIEYLEKYKDVIGGTSVMIIDKAKSLLQKEREQIEDAYCQGLIEIIDEIGIPEKAASYFFTQTYKQ